MDDVLLSGFSLPNANHWQGISHCCSLHSEAILRTIIGGADPELPTERGLLSKKNTKKLGVATFLSRPNHKPIPNIDFSLGVFTTPKW